MTCDGVGVGRGAVMGCSTAHCSSLAPTAHYRLRPSLRPLRSVAVRVGLALTMASLILSYGVDLLGLDLLVEKEAADGGD
jgi:hypothetical protein